MEKKAAFSKVLTIVGTALVWFPILAPVVLGFISLGMDGVFRLDYLMPAELGILVFVGGALLLWGAIRTRSRRGIIACGFGLAAGSIAILISFGDVVPGSLEWAIVVGLLITYTLAIVVMGIGGILLWRDLSRNASFSKL
jgi:hypothetical protein